MIGGALAAGVAAAVGVPLDRAGVGWLLTALVLAGAVVAAARSAGTRWEPARIGWGVLTVALVGSGAVRAAGWLFVLCLLTAAVTGSLALTGGRSWRGVVLGACGWPVAVLRGLPWVVRGTATLRSGHQASVGRAVLTVGATALLLGVFGALFASADAQFARLIAAVTPEVTAATVVRWFFLFSVGVVALAGAAYLVSAPPDLSGLERPGTGRLRRSEWMLPMVALNLLFGVFVAVQFAVLFGGSRHVLGPGGPDFAQYARGGFWQLLMVTVLTLAVLAAVARWARRESRLDRALLRALLGLLAVFTMVVVASALYRMHVYQEAYGFTRLRLVVFACELWLGGVFALILAAGVRLRGGWLPRAVLATAVGTLLGLVALDPDRFIAERNVDRYAASRNIDVTYLGLLSADAVPALTRLPVALRGCALAGIAADLRRVPDDWRGWNLARVRARAALAAVDHRQCVGYRIPG